MRWWRSERGSASLEIAIVAPVLLMLFSLVIVAGRVALASNTVNQIAFDAARAASIERTAGEAQAAAEAVVAASAVNVPQCAGGISLAIDTSPFSLPLGQTGQVTANVSCSVPLGDLVVPGLPGAVTLSGQGSSPLDAYRGRG